MRITPKNYIRQELNNPTHNNTLLGYAKDNPEDLVSIQVEQLVQNLRQYKPISDVVEI